ncbi:MAG: glycosyltransferase family 2 protein [Patescibacteria group bacterium]|jgi:hypothetical protein
MIKTIGVIICNQNGFTDTAKCIESIKTIRSAKLDILVIDNGSEMSDFKKIQEIKDISVIRNEKNYGYARGNNQGILYFLNKSEKPGYILLLNNDAFCEEDFLFPLLKILDKSRRVGAVNPLIYYAKERNRIWSSGGKLNMESGSISSDYMFHNPSVSIKEPYLVDFVSGCACLVRTEIFQEVGLLEESYEMYVEDVEFSLRVRNHGWVCMVEPRCKIYHKVSASSGGTASFKKRYYISRNTMFLAKTYFEEPRLFIQRYLLGQILGLHNYPIASIPFLLFATLIGSINGLILSGKRKMKHEI